ncbi:claudin-34-like [Cheilinus undulatus]|uniref:claudin-34-like n=1 Tax=Cheilinus undulatus TaxID=241271 RepID=UPI001BD36E03|nr:claudin-34-like [Cheilinus undulatus]
MAYLAHTAHAQLIALWLGFMGWTLMAVAPGLVQWRVWRVSDTEVISSGVAWVGIWRACFNSHTVVTPGFLVMHCEDIRLSEAFTPPEMAAGQVLMLLSVLVGLCGNAGGVYAMRNIYFGMERNSLIRLAFLITGVLSLLAAVMALIPLLWNIHSVVTNQTVDFPARFKMPPAPDSQQVGGGIRVGMAGSILMVISGIIFCSYRIPVRSRPTPQSSQREELHLDRSVPAEPETDDRGAPTGEDNPAYESPEHLC